MPSKTIAVRDAKKWVENIKELGIKRFKLNNLPPELKNKRLLCKASYLKLIEIIEKDSWNVVTWTIK